MSLASSMRHQESHLCASLHREDVNNDAMPNYKRAIVLGIFPDLGFGAFKLTKRIDGMGILKCPLPP